MLQGFTRAPRPGQPLLQGQWQSHSKDEEAAGVISKVCHQNAEQRARSPESFEAIEGRSSEWSLALLRLCSADFCTKAKEQQATTSSLSSTERRSGESTADVDNDEDDDDLAGKGTTNCKGNTMIVIVLI